MLGARSHVERLLEPLADNAGIVTVTDGHPEALSWIGGVLGHRVKPLGVEHFGQSGSLPDLFAKYRIDSEAILDACAAALEMGVHEYRFARRYLERGPQLTLRPCAKSIPPNC